MDLSKSEHDKLSGSVATILRKSEFEPQQLLDILRRFAQSTNDEHVKNEEVNV
jgi:hypothetical protein